MYIHISAYHRHTDASSFKRPSSNILLLVLNSFLIALIICIFYHNKVSHMQVFCNDTDGKDTYMKSLFAKTDIPVCIMDFCYRLY